MLFKLNLIPHFKGNLLTDTLHIDLLEHRFHFSVKATFVPKTGDLLSLKHVANDGVSQFEREVNAFLTQQESTADFQLRDYTLVAKVQFYLDNNEHHANELQHEIFILLENNAKPKNKIGFH